VLAGNISPGNHAMSLDPLAPCYDQESDVSEAPCFCSLAHAQSYDVHGLACGMFICLRLMQTLLITGAREALFICLRQNIKNYFSYRDHRISTAIPSCPSKALL
jgi:hypothetical protein